MPAPLVATYSAAALVAAHTALLALLDAGAGAGLIRVRSASDLLLGQVSLTDPAGTVNTGTGQLTLGIAGPDTNCAGDGTAYYAEICDSAGTVHLALLVDVGTVAVPGFIVMNTSTVVAGGTLTVLTAVIG